LKPLLIEAIRRAQNTFRLEQGLNRCFHAHQLGDMGGVAVGLTRSCGKAHGASQPCGSDESNLEKILSTGSIKISARLLDFRHRGHHA